MTTAKRASTKRGDREKPLAKRKRLLANFKCNGTHSFKSAYRSANPKAWEINEHSLATFLAELTADKCTDKADLKKIPNLLAHYARVCAAVRAASENNSDAGNAALRALVEQASLNTKQIEVTPPSRVRPIAAYMVRFPLLCASLPSAQGSAYERMKKLGVGLAFPNWHPGARAKADAFAERAAWILDQLSFNGINLSDAAKSWDDFEEKLRNFTLPSLLQDKRISEPLEKLIHNERFPSRIRQRVKDRLVERIRTILGLNKSR